MRKQLLGFSPFISSELPGLACGEDRDDTGPVVRLEVFGGVDDDEAVGFVGIGQRAHGAGQVEEVGAGLGGEDGMVEGDEEALVEEGLDVGHA